MKSAWPVAAVAVCLSAGAVAAPSAADRPDVEVVGLAVDAMAEPLGLDDPAPRLSWRLQSARRGVMQTAYRVLVASRPERVREGGADVWDSKEVASSDPWVVYAGPALASRARYYWSVRLWAGGGLSSEWAAPTWFETAFLGNEWTGPVDRRSRADTRANGGRRRGRRCDDPRRGRAVPSGPLADPWLRRGAHHERPG